MYVFILESWIFTHGTTGGIWIQSSSDIYFVHGLSYAIGFVDTVVVSKTSFSLIVCYVICQICSMLQDWVLSYASLVVVLGNSCPPGNQLIENECGEKLNKCFYIKIIIKNVSSKMFAC